MIGRNPSFVKKVVLHWTTYKFKSGLEFRELTCADALMVQSHLLRLDAKDRFLRFCNVLDDERVRSFVENIDWKQSSFVGCFSGGSLWGVLQLSTLANGNDHAEFALSVDQAHRGAGIARALSEAAVALARKRGLKSLVITSLVENKAISHLARSLGFELSLVQQQVIGELEL